MRIALLVATCAAPAARATIVAGNGETTNVNSPANFNYWNNIGYVPFGATSVGGTGIYLGDGWVLTANHVQGGVNSGYTFVIPKLNNGQDAVFTPVPGMQSAIRHSPSATADIAVFKLQDSPLLAALPRIQFGTTPQVNTAFTMIGSGYNRGSTLRYWVLSAPNNPDESTWTDITDTGANKNTAHRRGYFYDPSGFAKRWGTNKTVTMPGNGPTFEFNNTVLFGSNFDEGATNEAQGAPGDSGGGAFVGNRLTGLTLYIGDDRAADGSPANVGQPANTAVYKNSTFFADLYSYVDEIASVTKFHPSVDGDANLDGLVDDADFKIFYDSYKGNMGSKWTEGDFNLDGRVDFLDFQRLELNFGSPNPAAASEMLAALASVPEPGSAMVLGIAAFALLARRRR